MAIIPFSSAPRIARDAKAAADLREQEDAAAGKRYREGADARLNDLRKQGVKKFDPNGGAPMIDVPAPVPEGGFRLNAPGVETPDPWREPGGIFSDNYQPEEGDPLWDQYESDRTGPNKPIDGVYAEGGNAVNGTGGPENAVKGLTPEQTASMRDFMAKRDEQSSALSTRSALLEQTKTPDQIAEALQLAGKTGANRGEVEEDVETFRKLDTASQLELMRKSAPKLRAWMDDPINLEVAHDDVESLSWWDQMGRAFARTDELKAQRGRTEGAGLGALTEMSQAPDVAGGVAIPGIDIAQKIPGALSSGYAVGASGFWGVLRAPVDINDQFVSWATGRPQESGLAQWMRGMQDTAAGAGEDWMPESDDPTTRGILSGFQSLPVSGMSILTAIMTGNPAAGVGVAGGLTGGDAYGKGRRQGMSATGAAGYGLGQGTIEAATELLPMKWLVGDLAKKTPFVEALLRQTAAEVPGEQIATATQDFLDWAVLPENADKPISEYLAERPGAAYETLVAAIVGSGIQTTLAQAADATLQKVSESYQQKRAEDLANYIRAMGDNAKDSKLLKRLPDKYREAVAAATKDGPRENVRISPEGIAELAQSKQATVEQLAQAFRIDPEVMVQAMDSGDDIIVPSGNFAAVIQTAKKDIGVSGETIYQALAPHIRLNENDFTARESEVFQKIAKAEADARATWNETENNFAASAETVETDIRDQIRAMGRFNEDTVDGQTRLLAQLNNVLASETGQDPAEHWKAHGSDIISAVTGEQRDRDEATLPQGGTDLPADATPTQRLIDMRARGKSNTEIAQELYPDVDPKTAGNRVKALASKHKGKIAERQAAIEGTATLAQVDMTPNPNGGSKSVKIGDTTIDYGVSRDGQTAEVILVKTPRDKRGEGSARQAMKALLEVADKNGLTVFLTADPMDKGVSKPRLEQFYKSLGFRRNTGRRADFRSRAAMVRDPKSLAQDGDQPNATITLNRTRALIRMFEGGNLSSLAHEGAHWYLDLLFKLNKSENAHPYVKAQMARILEFAGKSQEWDGMFNAAGGFTDEGVKLQEQFAEAFEVYLMTGKAPSVGMRAVFNTFKQWVLGVYKAFRKGVGQAVRDVGPFTQARIQARERELGRKMTDPELFEFVVPQELREVFDRMLATEAAITAAQTTMIRDSEAMSKAMLEKLDPEGKWKPERQQKFMDRMRERYAEAKERAEAALLARLMDERMKASDAVRREEERDVRREVASEIDERKEQRAFQVLSGQGWRDTREDQANAAAEEAEDMATLAQFHQVIDLDMRGIPHAPDNLTVIKNPTKSDLARLSVLPLEEREAMGVRTTPLRYVHSGDGDMYVWRGDVAIHNDVIAKLGISVDRNTPRGGGGMIEMKKGEPYFDGHLIDMDDDASLAQSQTHDPAGGRELDALGFYSAAFEAAKSVRPDVWNMGWNHARNSIVKGGAKIDGKRVAPKDTEIEYLGLDEMFYGTTLKGAELAEAVLSHIQAKRLMLVEDFARFDPKADNGRHADAIIENYNAVIDELERAQKNESSYRYVIRPLELERDDLWAQMEAAKYPGGPPNLIRGPGDIRLPGEDVPLFEAVIGLPEGVPGADYQAPRSHIGGKMRGTLVTAHGEERIDDKGQRTVFVGQVQSDMAQQARELKEAAREASDQIDRMRVVKAEASETFWVVGPGTEEAGPYASMPEAEAALALLKEDFKVELNVDTITAPLLKTSEWTNVAVRAMLYRAAREGFQSISFPTAETSEIIQGNDTAAQHYETNVKGALEKLAKQLGGEVRKGAVQTEGRDGVGTVAVADDGTFRTFAAGLSRSTIYATADDAWAAINANAGGLADAYVLDITPEMRRKIVSEGFPLFQTKAGKGRVAQPANIPVMRLNLAAVEEQYGPEAVAALPPQVRAYSAAATDADQFIELARDVKRSANKKHPKSLWKFLSTARRIGEGNDKISYRGIRDDGGELIKMIGAKKEASGLIADQEDGKRSRSYSIEQAALVAWENGYFSGEDPPSPQEFLDALRNDIDGQAKTYSRTDMALVDEINNAEQWLAWFDENGIDVNEKDQAVLKAQIEVKLSGQGENAIGPDEAAPFFGMADGKALLEGLKQGPLRDKLIREETQRRMTELHGDTFTDGTLMAEAMAYARNEIQHRQFEIELEALADAAGQRAQASLAKQTAIDNLRSKQVREVLNYNQWLTLSERWGKKAVEAAGKGDMAKAMEFARYRLINSIQYVEAKKMAEQIVKDVNYLKSFEKKAKRIKLAKAGQDYLEQMDQLLEGIELRKRTNKALNERASLAEWFAAKQSAMDPLRNTSGMTPEERMDAQIEEIERSNALAAMQQDASLRNYQSLTVEELSAVRDQADMIVLLARKEGKLLVEGERRSFLAAVGDVVAGIILAKPKKLPPESLASYAPKESGKRGRREYMAELRTPQAIIRMIDGKDNGPLAQYLLHRMNSAYGRKLARIREEEKRIVALYEAAYGKDLSKLRRDPIRIPGVEVPLAKMERLTVALYMGTEISRKRMRDGYGWDDNTLQAIIGTLDEKDWALVRSIWDYVNSLYPEANEAHQALHGLPLTKQPGIPIVTRFGVIDGSYFPLVYNPHQSSRAAQQALDKEAKQVAGRVGTRTASGFTKERVKGKVTLPVLLDFSVTLPRHVDEVVSSITTQKPLFDAGRILVHPEVEAAIVERHGRIIYNQLLNAMREARNGPELARLGAERALIRLRNGATIVGLGLNIKTAILQMGGHTNSVVRLGGPNLGAIGGARWLVKGIYRMGVGAQGMQNGLKFVVSKSEYMRNRRESQNREMADLRRKMEGGRIKGTMQSFIEQSSMFLIVRAQYYLVDAPLWLGAYEKGMASGMSEGDAIANADETVIDAQGGGEIYQLAGIQRGSPLLKIFTNFLSYSVTTWNLNVNRTRSTNFRNPGQAAAWALDMAILNWAPVLLTILATTVMMPGGDDDEDSLEEQALRQQLSFLMSQWGLFGQLGSAINDYTYTGPQGTRAFSDASKAVAAAGDDIERLLSGEQMTGDVIRPLNLALGAWFHYPAGALDRFVRGADAMMKGETNDPRALVSGPPR